ATGFALMVGITLGLPAGYYGGKIDTVLSFLANLVLAFPVILLFYLLVTPGIMDTPIPYAMAGVFFLFPIIFFSVLFWTRYKNRPDRLYILLGITLIVGGWIYLGLVFDKDPLHIVHIDPNQLNIFVAVVFASSPGVFRIVRGLVMDIKTRDYVAAAQTRGESPWYIMLWEILP
ncbi:MAG: ABC transporter permease, partial [Mesorhizobium sp.]